MSQPPPAPVQKNLIEGLSEQQTAEFYKLKIQDAYNLFKDPKKNYLEKDVIPAFMRYLGRFPSEQQVVDTVLPKIVEDDASPGINYERLESVILEILLNRDFWPDHYDDLLLCFRKLDKLGRGYIDCDRLGMLMTTMGIKFEEEELKNFLKFARSKEDPTKIFYEDYVHRLSTSVNKHTDKLYKVGAKSDIA